MTEIYLFFFFFSIAKFHLNCNTYFLERCLGHHLFQNLLYVNLVKKALHLMIGLKEVRSFLFTPVFCCLCYIDHLR